jgi:hypothetical protein
MRLITGFILSAALLAGAQLGPMGTDAPAREPQMATDGKTVYLAFGAGKAIYVSASADQGRTFSTPVKVAEEGIVPLSRHRGPRIAVARSTLVLTAVAGKTMSEGSHAHGLPSDGDLLVWRSDDKGLTWSKLSVINDFPGAPTEGLHALASDGKGRLFAVWLDHRSGKGTKLYGSESRDAGKTWSKNAMVYDSPDGTICECCHPSAAFGSDGRIVVMWRNWLGGSRDMYLSSSADGIHFAGQQKLGTGTWQLNACPMDGGGLVNTSRGLLTAWRRSKELYFAVPGEKEIGIGEGADISLAGGPDGAYAAWVSGGAIKAVKPGGGPVVEIAAHGAFPNVIATSRKGALVAFETDGRIEILPLP